jgi:hypothetical protein
MLAIQVPVGSALTKLTGMKLDHITSQKPCQCHLPVAGILYLSDNKSKGALKDSFGVGAMTSAIDRHLIALKSLLHKGQVKLHSLLLS